ncbi:MAG: AAA family ATPase [Betaproteobacteria bacterium CG2_30_59_46]|nr:MAG: AAA family ATPase [Betaproteobacteria bacterium CG2_30_59_46]
MYREHFGLTELPFGITPDTSFFFACSRYQEALNTLLVAARSGEGFIKITGEVGTGKTLLCRTFLSTLRSEFYTTYIPNPYLEPRTLMMALAEELEIPQDKDVDQYHLLKAINLRLLYLASEGKRVLLCLDEAQAMPLETLEALRLLTNLETEKRKLLQIVLFGQPELDQKLAQESIRQLKQRITFHYHLGPLNREELAHYIEHRLRVAGYKGNRLFQQAAERALYQASTGVPRLVNILAHKALLMAYGEGKYEVAARHVKTAAMDTPAASGQKLFLWWWQR